MARVTHVKKARKAIKGTDIKKGDSYYWWKFRFGGKHVSKEHPKRSQLTQSGFLTQLYDLQDRVGEFNCDTKDDFDSFKEEILSEIESLRDEQEEKRSNMPEQLQDSSSGELLQERYDALDSWHSEIDGIEVQDFEEESEDDNEESRVQEAIDELQGTDSGL